MPHASLPAISDAGVIATLRAPSADAAYRAVDALVEEGLVAIEVTYTTPDAGAVIAGVAERFGDRVLLGAGTLTTVAQVEEARSAGAVFLVSPGFDDEVTPAIMASGALSMIGGYTPTEVQRLRKIGVDVVKFFPGSIGGPAALKALRGPFPDVTYIPTGGVNAENLGDWLAAGAVAVGAGSELLPAAAVRDGDAETIRANARHFLQALRTAREAPLSR
ncbi:bifunctional 4-hydroxy-2-oxoglutarate aldolase/2-dehydro-3-deoxy-phosphogluconate aldolase [Microbacterium hatanonis]|uniref:Bifunctional 4-hydroxy-2-oxoglutarate aldolase/2-dehydro-3-deoxy-phosphogluconate aldolase n=1 Tax=Microbacterium hatanonis TaxID=404366 RepID=A0A5C8HW66_9MICO|nr:bifunctional 4-hydroxy-2-oxoglutarate aldolase/2-dehydro-3-deoxy-phosphogluconate aldolase [Microbacterium hatanonis]TXK10333.1 bifunctional 4-hydroxy-2-oxoglutarate aldolase/2-dehydro-3-deoxy-phosphogluconate aldolase [Microbacterium hatanonis]